MQVKKVIYYSAEAVRPFTQLVTAELNEDTLKTILEAVKLFADTEDPYAGLRLVTSKGSFFGAPKAKMLFRFDDAVPLVQTNHTYYIPVIEIEDGKIIFKSQDISLTPPSEGIYIVAPSDVLSQGVMDRVAPSELEEHGFELVTQTEDTVRCASELPI